MISSLQMVAFPEGDDGEADEGDHGRACGKTIQPIGQVDGIAPRRHQEVHPNDEQDNGDHPTGEFETDERLFHEADARLAHWRNRIWSGSSKTAPRKWWRE